MTTTTFKTQHDIPMDKMTFDKLSDCSALPKNNYKILDVIIAFAKYDEEFQIASFRMRNPFSIEQGSEYFIITINNHRLDTHTSYLINKRTGNVSIHLFDQIQPYNDLMDGLMRVYHRSENELLELDFISDELKKEIEFQRRLREFEEAQTNDEDNNDDSDDDGYYDVFSR